MSFTSPKSNKKYSGVYLRPEDLNNLAAGMERRPIIVNDLDISDSSIKKKLSSLLYTYYDDNVVESMPTCQCPVDSYTGLRGIRHIGKKCPTCKSYVESVSDSNLESHVWIRAPKGVKRLITPIAWFHLCEVFDKRSCKIMQWLVNPNYTTNIKDANTLGLLASFPKVFNNFQRSMNYFYTNFEKITEYLITHPAIRDKNKTKLQYNDLMQYFGKNKDTMFTRYIPLPSRMIFVMEANAKRAQADPELFSLLDAVNAIAGKECPTAIPLQPKRANAIAVTIQLQLAEHYEPAIKNKLGGKMGIFRQSVFGRRTHFTGRGVLSSIPGKHDYRHLFIPWGMGVELFRYRIESFLIKHKGYGMMQARSHIYKHWLKFDPDINEFFVAITKPNWIVPYSGVCLTNQRNPSLVRASSQLFGLAGIHVDPDVHTVHQSSLTFNGPNADLDGDSLNLTVATDKETVDFLSCLKPHKSIDDLHRPFEYNGNMVLANPTVANITMFLADGASNKV